jgi:hypothetical protein
MLFRGHHVRNRIIGALAVVVGGGVFVEWLPTQRSEMRMSYGSGQSLVLVFGALLVLVGGYFLITGGRRRKPS